ncbi:anaerobic nitric oxide reductase flavorubredoxin [Acidaminobacter sp. JC074]|uniref:anaerobic nitric oxide reductase flavorubredoxin n=1 Tax=Acidaminobacter sp. JC074 TaxID=2530199 RepID=UPI001F109E02|nr:anaerobic nitric oxide reductase flavorubredoxin [Acidaminobacter sp. JC074]MCH4888398.1 anaerobic nitric oxide reductase flavorubredoxin [Acidaminobacter sp. JC074]
MKKHIKGNVHWVGKIDWELRKFHGEELSTHNGSSYNSYLIQEEKTVLIDTVWSPFADEFVKNLESEIDLNAIDYIVINHGENDHSGALQRLMEKIPDTPIYCSKNAIGSLNGQYHQEWNLNVVKTGDTLDIGNGKQLVFVEMRMLHWPDSMATYMTGDNILFSNDAFGQHYASEYLFNDLVDQCDLYTEAMKYYANILNPFSMILKRKLDEIIGMNLAIDIIATSHGIIWRDNPLQIVSKYQDWCEAYQENQITIIYDTMWNGTKRMAEKIAEGIQLEDSEVEVKLYNISKTDDNDLALEVFKSKAIVVGSPTVSNSVLRSLVGFLHYMHELKFKNKKATAFGCFGWSGESPKVLKGMLEDAGFETIGEPLGINWNMTSEQEKEVVTFGQDFVKNLKG